MPPGIGKLVNLETLSTFVVREEGLNALAGLNLTGKLTINFSQNRQNAIAEARMSNLKGKKLTHLSLWRHHENEVDPKDDDEVLNCMGLPSTLKILEIMDLRGVSRLWWGIHDLPNIVCITISSCRGIQLLPSLGGLPYLKRLTLSYIDALEFIENGSENSNETFASSSTAGAIYFPSLEVLELQFLRNLKGWSRMEDTYIDQQVQQCQQLSHCFPRLLTLKLNTCSKLRSMPWSQFAALNCRMPQMLENLHINHCNVLDLLVAGNNDGNFVGLSAWEGLQSLRYLRISLMSRLLSIPSGITALTQLHSLEIAFMHCLRFLPVCIGQLTQLRSLSIKYCNLVAALPRSIRNLKELKELYIWGCQHLESRCKKPHGEDWHLIEHVTYVDIRVCEQDR